MIIVAGLSLKNLQPDVWNSDSPYYIPHLRAIMVSYGDFHQMPKQLAKAKQIGLRKYLNVPDEHCDLSR
jgi:7-cyano-7-deazaguanine tRNA-ribosyltransferase